MKRCPDCRRDYHDETLNFCLDDGTRLLEGPYVGDADTVRFLRGGISEAVTRNLPGTRHSSPETRHSSTVISRIWSVAVLGLAVIGIGTWYLVPRSGDVPISESTVSIPDSNIQKLYWEMSDSERDAFIVERSGLVQQLIGGGAEELDKDAISAIRG